MTKQQLQISKKKLAVAFGLFVRSNNFIYATYGVVYFNLRQAAFMDYLLRADIVQSDAGVEIGLTGAKIYNSLFYHLFLIPTPEIKQYLVNNFPKTYSTLTTDFTARFLVMELTMTNIHLMKKCSNNTVILKLTTVK